MTLCVMAKLKWAIGGIVRVFVMILGQPFWQSKESVAANFKSGLKLALELLQKPERQIGKDKEEHKRNGIAVSIDWVFEGLGKWS